MFIVSTNKQTNKQTKGNVCYGVTLSLAVLMGVVVSVGIGFVLVLLLVLMLVFVFVLVFVLVLVFVFGASCKSLKYLVMLIKLNSFYGCRKKNKQEKNSNEKIPTTQSENSIHPQLP